MTEDLTHPDPDSLNDLIEGVLPERERVACLAHLAVCAQCREVVFLAQEPATATPTVEKSAWWKGWWTPLPILGAAALAGVLVLSSVFLQKEKSVAPTPELVAREERLPQLSPIAAAPTPAIAKAERKVALPPPPVAPAPVVAQSDIPPAAVEAQAKKADVPADQIARVESPRVVGAGTETVQVQAAAPQIATQSSPAPPPLPARPSASPTIAAARTGIAGAVTDMSGAVVPTASIQARTLTGGDVRNAHAAPSGQFEIAGLKPGSYELKISAPGFRQTTKQVDVPANQMARADSTLSVGAVTESVVVSASASGKLSGNLPIAATVTQGKVTLATNTAGALFLSQNAGRKWKTIKPVWKGKVVALTTLPDLTFQLATDGGEIWLSRDGSRWLLKR